MSRTFAKAEYRPMIVVTAELKWLYVALFDLGPVVSHPMSFYCDNQFELKIA